jgi:hypothetical protein
MGQTSSRQVIYIEGNEGHGIGHAGLHKNRRAYTNESITNKPSIRFKDVDTIYSKVLSEEDKIVFNYEIVKNKTGTKMFMYRDLIDYMTNFRMFDYTDIEIHHRTILYSKPMNILNKVGVRRNTFCYVCNKFSDPETFVKHIGLPPGLELITEAYLTADNGKVKYPADVADEDIMYVTYSTQKYCQKCEPTKNFCCPHCCPHRQKFDIDQPNQTELIS